MNKIDQSEYYKEVASYYDDDARDFEQRYDENPVLQKIRNSFREVTERTPFKNILELGCGPGFDVEYFARKYPESIVYAIDISPEMIELTRKRCQMQGLENVKLAVGSAEDIEKVFSGQKFDMIYVYFGGLNTVFDLEKAARDLRLSCTDNATLVLTFVNRYYVTEIPLWLVKGRFGKAFERLRGNWRGYSDFRKIPSRVLSHKDIRKAFSSSFSIVYKRGYSILYPAWYRSHLLKPLSGKAELLWNVDERLSRTPFWNTGEYSLYEMEAL